MRDAWKAILVSFFVTACAAPQAVRAPCSLAIRLVPAEGVRSTQAISHRWQARDIYQYRLSLEAWDGATFSEVVPSLVLPGGSPQARFTNLKQGRRYQVKVVAEGNRGGTAPDFVLNALSPCLAAFDFSSGQDVENSLERIAPVGLDAVPFSGRATLLPGNTPAWAKSFKVELTDDAGMARYTGSYPVTTRMVLVNLRAGIRYQVALTASDKKGLRTVRQSQALFFDPSGQDLEQDQTLQLDF